MAVISGRSNRCRVMAAKKKKLLLENAKSFCYLCQPLKIRAVLV
jgi:hypothetical protein